MTILKGLNKVNISIVIPAYNEENIIADTICSIKKRAWNSENLQIMVVDGASSDKTVVRARKAEAVVIEPAERGRAIQMNAGAKRAEHNTLYFLHADTLPPEHFDRHIQKSIEQGYSAGCFRLSFDHSNFLLRFYSWFTRFDINAFRFGDQSLFISKKVFKEIGGFRSDHNFMEDQEIVRRIKRKHSFAILPEKVTTSARRYMKTGIVRLQLTFTLIFILYYLGLSQQKLNDIYCKLVR